MRVCSPQFALLPLVAALVFSATACRPERTVRERLTEAVAFRENGELERAENTLVELHRDAPDDPEVIGELVRVRLDDGRIAEAGALLMPALERLGEARPRALLRAARRYYRVVAREALGTGTAFDPVDAPRYREAAAWLAQSDDDNQAAWQLDYLRFVVGRARALLGGAATEPAPLDGLADAIMQTGRLRPLNAYLAEVGTPSVPEGDEAAALQVELSAIREATDRAAFNELFDRRFAAEWRAQLGRSKRYDAASDRVLMALPSSVTVPAEPTETQLAALATRHAGRLLHEIAEDLRGIDDVEVANAAVALAAEGATVVQHEGAWVIAAPVASLRQAAWAIDRVLEAQRLAEGSQPPQ